MISEFDCAEAGFARLKTIRDQYCAIPQLRGLKRIWPLQAVSSEPVGKIRPATAHPTFLPAHELF
jgi:hypothetical protein